MYTMYTSVLIVLLKACSHNLICAHFQLPLDAIYSALNCYMCNMMKRWIRWGGGGGLIVAVGIIGSYFEL